MQIKPDIQHVFSEMWSLCNAANSARRCFLISHTKLFTQPLSTFVKAPRKVTFQSFTAFEKNHINCAYKNAFQLMCVRSLSGKSSTDSSDDGNQSRVTSFLLYSTATVIFMVGLTYLCVPLYRIFCQVKLIEHYCAAMLLHRWEISICSFG